MSIYEDTRMDWQVWAAKFVGSAFGVLLSMVFVAPTNSRNAMYRILLAPIAGVIFAAPMQHIFWFLDGEGIENYMAAACAAGFTSWFVLEATARMMSSQVWLERLLAEILRLRGDKRE